MRNQIVAIISCILILVPSLFASGNSEEPAETGKPVVAVSILPQSFFVERIAGSLVDVVVLVGQGQSPHSYEPTPRQMAALSHAKAWILSGTDFEQSLRPKIASLYPDLILTDGTEGMTFRSLDEEGHDHDEEGHDHAEGIEIDRHTWLGHENALILAAHVRDTVVRLLPDDRDAIEENYRLLVDEIDRTFASLKTALAPLYGRTVFVYHPAFGYFFDDFGIVQKAVETGGKEPTAKTLSALISEAKQDHAAAIFVQSQFPVQVAGTVADAIGAKVVPLDPLAENWLENIRTMGDALLSAVGDEQ